jgi:hypothetical protein
MTWLNGCLTRNASKWQVCARFEPLRGNFWIALEKYSDVVAEESIRSSHCKLLAVQMISRY